jgi:UDP-N-acetylglucosamine--N-acetylmuramyl-(pentapeptide) pyrophosphoryl-undecaprenol N-acetylglucosamine transferase
LRINQAMAGAVGDLIGKLGLEVWHQTGDRHLSDMELVKGGLSPAEVPRYHPFAFADDLAEKIQAADLVLSRAGASALSEVSAIGIPMLLVPGPFAGGHQRLNAEPFASAGAAVIIANEDCDPPRLVREIAAIVESAARYSKMVNAMRSLGRPRAADDVVALIRAAVRS